MTSNAIAARLTTYATNTLGLPCEVLPDGRGGFVTRSTRESIDGVLIGRGEGAAKEALCRLIGR